MTLGIEDAVLRAKALATAPGRGLLGLTGPPGAGKSTLAERIVAEVAGSVLVGMDGFHLAHTVLTDHGTVGRKGAPDTFDAAGYVALLARLRAGEPGVIWTPEFRREIEDAIAGAVAVPPDASLVVTEGNYLLLPEAPWSSVPELLDEVWYVDLPDATRLERLVTRHERYGRTSDQARERSFGSDEANARLVMATRERAHAVIVAD
jgi:pantothenate kinase